MTDIAIINERIYKLDFYNNKVSNALYKCAEGESYCKSMISKLVFYDRDEIIKMHSDSLMKRNVKYDVSELQTISCVDQNEKIERVVPLEGHWIAVFFADKKTEELITNKVMYISSEGDGFVSDNIDCALNGTAPDEVYAAFVKVNPNALVVLDRKFEKDDFSESRKKLYDIARAEITDIFASVLGNPDIKLEDLHAIIREGFKNKEDEVNYEKARLLDFMYSNTIVDAIIEFDQKYNEYHASKQPRDGE